MFGQFILNLFIALLWLLLSDEDIPQLTTFFTGFVVGIGILYIMHRFFGTKFYLRRVTKIILLILIFIREILSSSYVIMKQILTPKLKITPGIIKYDTKLRGDWELTTLALLLTLTPGSVVMEVSDDGEAIYIHAMDLEDSRESLIKQIDKFERAIMEVTR
ncbi:Na+/H+ antiporter subunit E [Ureibacillus acetophenoni]|uniref:Multisubunit sodium/proton antiporter MrpE subunit n=1 Tax=Ureibacillus acetophenoni TaxID=614649 RepID=A0A285UKJ1_9BACL|nr:Na+/H+ antiporter subunit E [Ureibacillus acetophenoni]SOC42434.1 multisubunit sodium/proton antiporter MrpE subunit [Ureibacillus acetophenoni]